MFVVAPVTLVVLALHNPETLALVVGVHTTDARERSVQAVAGMITDARDIEVVALTNACVTDDIVPVTLKCGGEPAEPTYIANGFETDMVTDTKSPGTELRVVVETETTDAEVEMAEVAVGTPEANLNVAPDQIWMGWLYFESGNAAWRQVGGDGGRAYGRYQFDISFGLPRFLAYCLSVDSQAYAGFSDFVTGEGRQATMVTTAGLAETWTLYCEVYGESFFALQDQFAKELYYDSVKAKLLDVYGINIDLYSPVLRGTVWSIALRDGPNVSQGTDNNLYPVTETYYAGIDEAEWLNAIYDAETRRHPAQANRWGGAQRDAALQELEDLLA